MTRREKDQQHCLICLKQCKRAVSSRAEDVEVSRRLQVAHKKEAESDRLPCHPTPNSKWRTQHITDKTLYPTEHDVPQLEEEITEQRHPYLWEPNLRIKVTKCRTNIDFIVLRNTLLIFYRCGCTFKPYVAIFSHSAPSQALNKYKNSTFCGRRERLLRSAPVQSSRIKSTVFVV